jgi:uncharacterized membrane protein
VKQATWLFVFLAAASAGAQQRTLTIQSFDANIVVDQQGVVDVTETITAQFSGSWNGIYRSIPVEYRTPQGFSWTLKVESLSATDAEGRALKVERSRERHYLKNRIWIPGARDTTRTIVIHYRVPNDIRFFEDHDELYWNVTGDEWDVPLNKVTAKVTLPPQTTGIRHTAFTGAYGTDTRDAVTTTQGNAVFLTMNRNLGFREGASIVVGWDKGVMREPSGARKLVDVLAANWPLSIPAAVLVGMFLLWRKVGRDPEALPVAVQYEPPDEMTPAEVGTLLDESVDMRDVTATIVDLAVGGHLRIEEREEKTLLGLSSKSDFVFHRTQPPGTSRALSSHEQQVLSGIFRGSAAEATLSGLKNEFYTKLPGIRHAIYERLIDRGLHRTRPDQVKSRWTIAAVAIGALLGYGGGGPFAARLGLAPMPFIVAGIVSGIIILLFGRIMPARTITGARTLEKVRGFEEFLTRVESDRFAQVVKTPEMFEKFLPFAMAFGVEAKWARAFKSIYTEPPRWYAGTNSNLFDASRFSGRLSDMSEQAGKTMSSTPRRSGGSGFRGGFSGGGSGGGGGGGF